MKAYTVFMQNIYCTYSHRNIIKGDWRCGIMPLSNRWKTA